AIAGSTMTVALCLRGDLAALADQGQLTFVPALTFASVFTLPTAFAKMLHGLASRVSSPRLIGVRPKPSAIAWPSGQYAISPGVTTARASVSAAILTGISK